MLLSDNALRSCPVVLRGAVSMGPRSPVARRYGQTDREPSKFSAFSSGLPITERPALVTRARGPVVVGGRPTRERTGRSRASASRQRRLSRRRVVSRCLDSGRKERAMKTSMRVVLVASVWVGGFSARALAVPANPGVRQIVQPDGTKFLGSSRGDSGSTGWRRPRGS